MVTDSRQITFGLFIIADGMGGHQHGEIASGIAVRAMASMVLRKSFMSLISVRGEKPEESLQEIPQEGIMEAHRAIMKDAVGGGTTLTAALIFGEQLMIAHVGDSRAYSARGGRLEQVTSDHSWVNEQVLLGLLSREEASRHPFRNVITRALGSREEINPDIAEIAITSGDRLVLCSDGLTTMLEDREILDILHRHPRDEEAAAA